MKEIIAKGKIDGKDIEVRCLSDKNKFSFLFNGKDNKELEEKLKDMLRQHQRIGNYVPKTKELKLCAIFEKRGFFDMPAEDVEVYGDIEQIPYEDGVVY